MNPEITVAGLGSIGLGVAQSLPRAGMGGDGDASTAWLYAQLSGVELPVENCR